MALIFCQRLNLGLIATLVIPGLSLAAIGFGAETVITPLVPGLVVEELPVHLTNVNNLRFNPAGQLTALGYNGKVYLLVDANGDGLEDSAKVFWDKPTIRVPVGMAWSKLGLYVSSQGKVSLLRDTDGDGIADTEEVVASGWEKTDVGSGGVDATGVTLDPKGNVYFGVICANYSNPYRLEEGRPRYDIGSRRGTINRLSPDHAKPEAICTGIRVPYALAFNRFGDLFATDQEGETWLPGGNPLDELNQIVPGKHYGFPPRNAKYLPNVIDEPPVVAFGPQHQSACGLVFNEAVAGRAAFGPNWWEGDAFVAGESRGKIWRVRLTKTSHGYVGTPAAIARSTMLVTDVVVSPKGDLYVSCHSGPPDWGTGPEGRGKLFRIQLADRNVPQPILAYTTSPLEVHIAFDRPLDTKMLEGLAGERIEYGEYVRAADKLEVLKPPYEAVKKQERQHRGALRITAAKLDPERRSIILRTDPDPVAGTYALAINSNAVVAEAKPSQAIYLDYNLNGVQAKWTSANSHEPAWSGWAPHVDLDIVRGQVAESFDHEQLFALLTKPGTLEFRGKIKLPAGKVTIHLDSSVPCELTVGEVKGLVTSKERIQSRELTVSSVAEPLAFQATLVTETNVPRLHLTYHSDTDPTERVVELHRLLVPWAPRPVSITEEEKTAGPAEVTGDAKRGEAIFTGQVARCSACHAVRGQGSKIGPDLSQLVHREAGSILRDIREPSAMINPDYINYTLVLDDGRTLSGVLRAEGADSVRLASSDAKESVIALAGIEEMQPQPISMMPSGLIDKLTESETQDLLAYLVTPPKGTDNSSSNFGQATSDPRSILRAIPGSNEPRELKPISITLVCGKKDHGPGEHDYPAWQQSWTRLLKRAKKVTVDNAQGWPTAEQWQQSDVIVFYLWNHDWSSARYRDVDGFLARGKGVVAIHSALIADSDPEKLAERWGLAAQPVRTKYRHGPLQLVFDKHDSATKLTAGFVNSPMVDETYWPMIGDASRVRVLASAIEEDRLRPMLWTYEPGKGRVFASVLGHYTKSLEDHWFQILLLRGIAWAAGEPIARFQELPFAGIQRTAK